MFIELNVQSNSMIAQMLDAPFYAIARYQSNSMFAQIPDAPCASNSAVQQAMCIDFR